MIGIDYSTAQTILENPVVSDIVLKRGWTEPAAEPKSAAVKSFSQPVNAPVEFEPYFKGVFKPKTGFPKPVELKKMEIQPANMDEFEKRADELVEKYINGTR